MVSQLSAALLMSSQSSSSNSMPLNTNTNSEYSGSNGRAIPTGTSNNSSSISSIRTSKSATKRCFSSSSLGGSSGSSGGYMADQSELVSGAVDLDLDLDFAPSPPTNTSMPLKIDILSRMAKREVKATATAVAVAVAVAVAPSTCVSSEYGSNKRFKTSNTFTTGTAERNYMTSMIKKDLENGGLSFQKIQKQARRARAFPQRSGVDMSTVSHLLSNEIKSPFLLNTQPLLPLSLIEQSKNRHYLECPFQLMAMMQATSCYYRPVIDEPLPKAFSMVVDELMQRQEIENEASSSSSDETDSTTSSFTVSDTGVDAVVSSSGVVNDCDRTRPLQNTATAVSTKQSSSAIVPIGEALSISRNPRIITLSKAPYNVVQVNAAFLRLTGSASTADLLGKPLRELTADGTLIAALKESLASLQVVAVPAPQSFQIDAATKHRQQQHTTATVTPVGVPGKDAKITHFAIKLRNRSSSSGSDHSTRSNTHRNTNTNNAPINVMG